MFHPDDFPNLQGHPLSKPSRTQSQQHQEAPNHHQQFINPISVSSPHNSRSSQNHSNQLVDELKSIIINQQSMNVTLQKSVESLTDQFDQMRRAFQQLVPNFTLITPPCVLTNQSISSSLLDNES